MIKKVYGILLLVLIFNLPLFAQDTSSDIPTNDAAGNEWEGFDYEQLGLTQWEFQQVKEAGIPREKLLYMIEIGVRPGEYLQKPWERLNVSEEDWLVERARGMEDSDIDRSYRYRSGNQGAANLSLLLPSYYQWKTGNTSMAISMNVLWATFAGAYAYMLATEEDNSSVYMLFPLALVHVWSFGHGWYETRFESNPDANRFAWGIAPIPGGAAGGLAFQF